MTVPEKIKKWNCAKCEELNSPRWANRYFYCNHGTGHSYTARLYKPLSKVKECPKNKGNEK